MCFQIRLSIKQNIFQMSKNIKMSNFIDLLFASINSSIQFSGISMNLYYFGDMQEYIQTGYAPTGRAKCKGCKELISKDSVRIGICMDNPNDHANFGGKNWYHQPCFTLKPRFKDLNPEQQIYQLDQLDPEHYDIVLAHVQAEVQRVKQGKKASKKKATVAIEQQKKQQKKGRSKKVQKQQDHSDQQFDPKKGKAKSKGKAAQKKSEKASMKSQRSASKSVARSSRSKASKQSQKKGKSAQKKTKKKAAKKQQPKEGYTPAQKAQFQQLFQKYMGMSADALKNILATNLQSRTGNKSDLAEKCADGKILGRIPMCTSCGGGRLRFDRKIGVYNCPGYMDDDVFRNCGKKYTMQEVARDPWTEP